jgi:outer membrane receptor protein involved in Fe transport
MGNQLLLRTLALSLLTVGLAFGQLTRGFISGTVQDATGAVMPDVTVKITNKATNLSNEVQTNARGIYRFVAVEPGIYAVEFTKAGFETRQIENVQVSTNQEVTLNQELAVGGTATTVEVQDAPPGVELAKSSGTIERTLPEQFVENIPLTGATRDVNRLALFAPTVAVGPGSTGISANGNRARNNNFMVDGVDNNDASVTLSANRAISEGISQFQVQTSVYSAEYGRSSGAQINIITKSGSNSFHGEVWDYYRGNFMEPVSLLNRRAGVNETPRFVHNQAGGNLGGRLIRDRTFFFGLVETNRRREAPDARNASSVNIPTPEGYAALAGVPLGTNQTTTSRQAVLGALAFLPEVHQQVGGNYQNITTTNINGVPIQVGNARIPLANPSDYWYYQGRVDHRLTDSQNLSYRLQLDKRNQPDVTSNLGFGQRFSAAQTILGQNHMWTHTYSITPTLINEARVSYVRRSLDFPENDPTSPNAGITGYFNIGGLSNFPQGRTQDTYQFQNVTTKLLGNHSLRFGADIRYTKLFNLSAFDSKGTFTFNNLADFLNNNAFSFRQAVNEATFDARQHTTFFFFQDDYKVTRDLTLNIGMRYEYNTVPLDGFFGAANDEIAAALVPRPVRPDKNNWAPRVGFAYSPSNGGALFGDGLTVIRGGYGIGYDVLFYNIATVNASNYPRVVTQLVNNVTNQYPTLLPKEATVAPFNPLTAFVNANEDLQSPTSHYYSLSVQRQFGKNYIAEVGYSGNRNYHQIRQGQLNPAVLTPAQAQTVLAGGSVPAVQARRLYPQFGARTTIESTALSNYNAAFVRFDRKFDNGLIIGSNYTFGKTMSDNDESLGVADITNSSPQVPQSFFDYDNEWSLSVFDRPHRFVVYYNYNIPGENVFQNPVLRRVIGGWGLTGSHEWQSGQPFTIRTGVDSIGQGAANASRPNYNPSGVFTNDPIEGNLRTFSTPINGTGIVVTPLAANGTPLANSMPNGGNLGRNTFRGPAYALTNFSLFKDIRITERWRARLKGDFINAFNHRNFGNPVATMVSPNFGQNTTDPGGRTMLVSARIIF